MLLRPSLQRSTAESTCLPCGQLAINWTPKTPVWPVIAGWQKAMPQELHTLRRWPTAWCVTRPSIRRSVVSYAIRLKLRSNPLATRRASLTSTQIEMPGWTNLLARFAMQQDSVAWAVTSEFRPVQRREVPLKGSVSQQAAEKLGKSCSGGSVNRRNSITCGRGDARRASATSSFSATVEA